MASSGPEGSLLCCICCNAFTDPVSPPCGHNFCKNCCGENWDKSNCWKCPLCNEQDSSPVSESAGQFRTPASKFSKMLCNACTGIREKSVKICLNCEASYCKTHLEPHETNPVFKKHKLIDPDENLKDYICQKHYKPLKLFCKDDQKRVCLFCAVTDHKTHNTVPIEELQENFNKKGISWIQILLLLSIPLLIFLMSTTICIRFYTVDVTLDTDTAHPELILSDDGKQVTHGDTRQNLPDNPERFDQFFSVLGKQGFSSGRFYYEVQVSGKTCWDVGVARESINRKGGDILPIPNKGLWTLSLTNGHRYFSAADKFFSLPSGEKPQKVGVFVDYDEGLVSFYNAETRSHISSFTGQIFTEKLYPYFSPCNNKNGQNSAPLIISGGYKGRNIQSKFFHNLANFFRQISLVFDS